MHPSKQKLVIYNENSFLSLTWAPASFDSRLDDGVGRGWGDEADSCLSFAQQKSQLQYKKNYSTGLPGEPLINLLIWEGT